MGARLSRQPLDVPDQDGDRQDGHGICTERPAHLGVVDRLERRGVPELDRQLRRGAAPMSAAARTMRLAAGLLPLLFAVTALAAKTQNVVLIVSDGLRWQEVFTGAEEDLLNDKAGGSWLSDKDLRKRYWRATPSERRAAWFPF